MAQGGDDGLARAVESGRDGDVLTGLARLGVLAPSSHNTQPWSFRLADGALEIAIDRRRALPVVDPEGRELAISVGAALGTIELAAAALGIELAKEGGAGDLVATLRIAARGGAHDPTVLDAIRTRRTVRSPFDAGAVAAETIEALIRAAEPVSLAIVAPERRPAIAELVHRGDRAQWRDRAWRGELAAWMRPRDRGDGLAVPRGAHAVTGALVRGVDLGIVVARADRRLALSAPVLACLTTREDGREDWIDAGRALARVLVAARRAGLQAGYLNQPVQVPSLRTELRALLGGAGHPQLLVRLGLVARELPAAPRHPLAAVLTRG